MKSARPLQAPTRRSDKKTAKIRGNGKKV